MYVIRGNKQYSSGRSISAIVGLSALASQYTAPPTEHPEQTLRAELSYCDLYIGRPGSLVEAEALAAEVTALTLVSNPVAAAISARMVTAKAARMVIAEAAL
jgi:hypothetical protein